MDSLRSASHSRSLRVFLYVKERGRDGIHPNGYVEGTELSQIWFDLKKDEIISLMDQLAKVESIMMSISFPAGGSIYYARDLKNLSGNPLDEQIESISLEKERLCIGTDISVSLWYGRREKLDVFRGPCTPHFSCLFLTNR